MESPSRAARPSHPLVIFSPAPWWFSHQRPLRARPAPQIPAILTAPPAGTPGALPSPRGRRARQMRRPPAIHGGSAARPFGERSRNAMTQALNRIRIALNLVTMTDEQLLALVVAIGALSPQSALMTVPAIAASTAAVLAKGAAFKTADDAVTGDEEKLRNDKTAKRLSRGLLESEVLSLAGLVANNAKDPSQVASMAFTASEGRTVNTAPPEVPQAIDVTIPKRVHGRCKVSVDETGTTHGRYVAEQSPESVRPDHLDAAPRDGEVAHPHGPERHEGLGPVRAGARPAPERLVRAGPRDNPVAPPRPGAGEGCLLCPPRHFVLDGHEEATLRTGPTLRAQRSARAERHGTRLRSRRKRVVCAQHGALVRRWPRAPPGLPGDRRERARSRAGLVGRGGGLGPRHDGDLAPEPRPGRGGGGGAHAARAPRLPRPLPPARESWAGGAWARSGCAATSRSGATWRSRWCANAVESRRSSAGSASRARRGCRGSSSTRPSCRSTTRASTPTAPSTSR